MHAPPFKTSVWSHALGRMRLAQKFNHQTGWLSAPKKCRNRNSLRLTREVLTEGHGTRREPEKRDGTDGYRPFRRVRRGLWHPPAGSLPRIELGIPSGDDQAGRNDHRL